MTDWPCRCDYWLGGNPDLVPCPFPATQEDGLCDACRRDCHMAQVSDRATER